MSEVLVQRITRRPGICGGKACITGHRIRVMDIAILSERLGMTPDEIVTQLPSISLSDVHAALAYYYEHLDEIRQEMQSESDYVADFMNQYPSALEAKLKQIGMSHKSE